MSRSTVLLRNIASNWVGFAVNAAVTLVLTPYVLRELGVARYGIWVLTSSLIGYYGFLDLGLRGGITQYLTRYLAVQDYRRGSECLSTAVTAFSLLGVVMAALSIAGAYVAPHVFSITDDLRHEAFWAILLVGMSSAVECVFAPFGSVFTAKQRFDLGNLIGICTRLMMAAGVVIALETGSGLIGVSIASCSVTAIDYAIRWRVALRLEPNLQVSRKLANVGSLREIASFGVWNFLMTINGYVCIHVPNMLIGVVMPIAAVGHYALATGLFRQVVSVLSPVPQVIYPAATEMHAQDNLTGLESLYHKASRLMMLIMIPIVLIAAIWSHDFYRLWIGERYLSGNPFHSVAVIFQILLVSTVTNFSSVVASQIITGTGRVRLVSTALIVGSVINLTLSLVLIRPFGLAGVAAANMVASVAIDLIAMPLMLRKVLGFRILPFVRVACIRPIAAGICQAVLMIGIKYNFRADTLIDLVGQGILAGGSATVVLILVGLTKEDRRRFVVAPFNRLMCSKTINGIAR